MNKFIQFIGAVGFAVVVSLVIAAIIGILTKGI